MGEQTRPTVCHAKMAEASVPGIVLRLQQAAGQRRKPRGWEPPEIATEIPAGPTLTLLILILRAALQRSQEAERRALMAQTEESSGLEGRAGRGRGGGNGPWMED